MRFDSRKSPCWYILLSLIITRIQRNGRLDYKMHWTPLSSAEFDASIRKQILGYPNSVLCPLRSENMDVQIYGRSVLFEYDILLIKNNY